MLQEEIWFNLLSRETAIDYEQIVVLWSAFLAQLEQRLVNDSSVDMHPLGYWELSLREEFLGYIELDDQKETFIVPPSLNLVLQAKPKHSSICLLADFKEGLALQTKLSEASILRFLELFPKLIDQEVRSGREVYCALLGVFSPLKNNDDEEKGYHLSLSKAFAESLNKPFAMFSPIEVNLDEEKKFASLSIRELSDKSELSLPLEYDYYLEHKFNDTNNIETMKEENEIKNENLTLGKSQEEPFIPITENKDLTLVDDGQDDDTLEEVENLDLGALPSDDDETLYEEKKRKRRGCFFYILFLLLLLAISYALMLLYPFDKVKSALKLQDQEPVEEVVKEKPLDTISKGQLDSLIKGDSLKQVQAKVESKAQVEPALKQEQPATESVEKPIEEPVEIIVIRWGHTLRKIALKKYGHKSFWVYIYQENKALIKNPNNVPIGTKLKLPPKSKYNIDAKDNNSVRKALKLEHQIFAKFK